MGRIEPLVCQASKVQATIEMPATAAQIGKQQTALHHLASIMLRHVNLEARLNSVLGCHLKLHPVALDGCLHSTLHSVFERQIVYVPWQAHRGMPQFLLLVHLEGTGLGQGNVGFHGCKEKSRKLLSCSATLEHPVKLRNVVSYLLYIGSANIVREIHMEGVCLFLGLTKHLASKRCSVQDRILLLLCWS